MNLCGFTRVNEKFGFFLLTFTICLLPFAPKLEIFLSIYSKGRQHPFFERNFSLKNAMYGTGGTIIT